ncbi:hypothetical protein HDU96_001781 [Phlyctochytrium bullatum]|nr:hypothetical protein HDU96_001781 [Phlyctochytrium bullatum]
MLTVPFVPHDAGHTEVAAGGAGSPTPEPAASPITSLTRRTRETVIQASGTPVSEASLQPGLASEKPIAEEEQAAFHGEHMVTFKQDQKEGGVELGSVVIEDLEAGVVEAHEDEPRCSWWPQWLSKDNIRFVLESDWFHKVVIGIVCVDLLMVFADVCLTIVTSCSPRPHISNHTTHHLHTGDASHLTFAPLSGLDGPASPPFYHEENTMHAHAVRRQLEDFITATIPLDAGPSATATYATIGPLITSAPELSSISGAAPETLSSSAPPTFVPAGERPQPDAAAAEKTCTPTVQLTPALDSLLAAFVWVSVSILTVFAIEIAVSVYAFGWVFLKRFIHGFDALVVVVSLFLELYLEFTMHHETNSSAIILLRIWKMIRCMHAIAHMLMMRTQRMVKTLEEVNNRIESDGHAMQKLIEFQKERIGFIASQLSERKTLLRRVAARRAARASMINTVANLDSASADGTGMAAAGTKKVFGAGDEEGNGKVDGAVAGKVGGASDRAVGSPEEDRDRMALEEIVLELEKIMAVLEATSKREGVDLKSAVSMAITIAERDTVPLSRRSTTIAQRRVTRRKPTRVGSVSNVNPSSPGENATVAADIESPHHRSTAIRSLFPSHAAPSRFHIMRAATVPASPSSPSDGRSPHSSHAASPRFHITRVATVPASPTSSANGHGSMERMPMRNGSVTGLVRRTMSITEQGKGHGDAILERKATLSSPVGSPTASPTQLEYSKDPPTIEPAQPQTLSQPSLSHQLSMTPLATPSPSIVGARNVVAEASNTTAQVTQGRSSLPRRRSLPAVGAADITALGVKPAPKSILRKSPSIYNELSSGNGSTNAASPSMAAQRSLTVTSVQSTTRVSFNLQPAEIPPPAPATSSWTISSFFTTALRAATPALASAGNSSTAPAVIRTPSQQRLYHALQQRIIVENPPGTKLQAPAPAAARVSQSELGDVILTPGETLPQQQQVTDGTFLKST